MATGIEAARTKNWLSILQAVLLIWTSLNLARDAHRTVFRYAADVRNPYVYAHTSADFMNLVRRIGEIEAVSSKGKELYIQVIAEPDETWPLPFYLRAFPNTGYWTNAETAPTNPRPDLLISSADFEAAPADFLTEFYGLRPDTLIALHIDSSLWNAFLETRK